MLVAYAVAGFILLGTCIATVVIVLASIFSVGAFFAREMYIKFGMRDGDESESEDVP